MDVAQRSICSGERSVIWWCLCVIAGCAAPRDALIAACWPPSSVRRPPRSAGHRRLPPVRQRTSAAGGFRSHRNPVRSRQVFTAIPGVPVNSARHHPNQSEPADLGNLVQTLVLSRYRGTGRCGVIPLVERSVIISQM